MNVKNNIFSSKPKQISQATLQILLKVFGELNKVKLIVASDMELPINIAKNFETSGLKHYEVFYQPLEKLFPEQSKDTSIKSNLICLLKDYDMIMIGYKNQLKLIDKHLVKKILYMRKQKPLFFIDCGIPGNININVRQIPNCFLFDLNDLEQLYSSWIQNNSIYEDTNRELYDIELKSLIDSFFDKLNLNLEQKLIFEKRINSLLKKNNNEIKYSLMKFLKTF